MLRYDDEYKARASHLCLCCVRVLLLAGPDLPEVELELLALQDVPVRAAGLPWPAGDGRVQTASRELALEERVDLGVYAGSVRNFSLAYDGEHGRCSPFFLSSRARCAWLDSFFSSVSSVSFFTPFLVTGCAYYNMTSMIRLLR